MLARSKKVALAMFILRFLPIATAQAPTSNYQLPEYIHQCYRNDPKYAECFKTMLYGVIRKLKTGIPEFDVPPIEPLLKDEIEAFDVAGFQFKVTNLVVRGVSNIRFSWNSASASAGVYESIGDIPEVTIEARYELRGAIFFLPIHSAGTIFVRANLHHYAKAITKIVTENGTRHMKLDVVQVNVHINDGSLWIGNLGVFEVPINRLLNTKANKLLVIGHVTPIVDDVTEYIMCKFANYVLKTVPYDVMLPEGTGPAGTQIGTESVGTVELPEKEVNSLLILKRYEFLKRVHSMLN